MIIAYTLAVLIGLALGLLGGGGSIITVPVLVYAAKIPPQTAIVMALAIVGVTSVAGSITKARRGLVHGRAALLFSSTGIVGAFLGAQLTSLVPAPVLLSLFAFLMLIVAGAMLIKKNETELPASSQCRPWRCASAGMGVGAMTGFIGVGGGFLIVPALVHFGNVPLTTAVGTSLVVIAINSFAGLAGHWQHGALNWGNTLLFSIMALIGMAAGEMLTPRIPRERLRKGFAWFVIAVALFVLVEVYTKHARDQERHFPHPSQTTENTERNL